MGAYCSLLEWTLGAISVCVCVSIYIYTYIDIRYMESLGFRGLGF